MQVGVNCHKYDVCSSVYRFFGGNISIKNVYIYTHKEASNGPGMRLSTEGRKHYFSNREKISKGSWQSEKDTASCKKKCY